MLLALVVAVLPIRWSAATLQDAPITHITFQEAAARVPGWDPGCLVGEEIRGGLSNRNFKVAATGACPVASATPPGTQFVLRVAGDIDLPVQHSYGPVHGVERAWEVAVARAAGDAGLSPHLAHGTPSSPVLGTEWLPGARPLQPPEVVRRADELAQVLLSLHRVVVRAEPPRGGPYTPMTRVRNYLQVLADRGLPHPGPLLDAALATANVVDSVVAGVTPRRHHGVLHCDLVGANIIDTDVGGVRKVCVCVCVQRPAVHRAHTHMLTHAHMLTHNHAPRSHPPFGFTVLHWHRWC